ncbi:MAG: methyltransferase domain-containing protein [Patescibacteria group bacterium]
MADEKLEKIKHVYSFWGRFSKLYDAQDAITFLGRARDIRRSAAQGLGLKPGDSVLEVACGSGRDFPYLIEAVGPEGKIIGQDYSPEMLEAAKKLCAVNGWTNVTLMAGDAAKLDLDKTGFDGVLSILGISAVPDWRNAIQKCFGVLKVGGKLVVCDARLFSGWLAVLNPLVKAIYSRFAAWDPSKDIPQEMRTIFGNVEIKTYNFGTFFIASSEKKSGDCRALLDYALAMTEGNDVLTR